MSEVRKPTWSSEGDRGINPSAETRPKLGLKPTTPQYEAGRMIDPIVCVPRAAGQSPAAPAGGAQTAAGDGGAAAAAAEPLLEPWGVCRGLCGFRVGPAA